MKAKTRRLALGLLLLHLWVLGAAWITPHPPYAQDRQHPLAAPSGDHPLGTDEFGRDQLSRLIWGGQISLFAALLAALLSLACGLTVGAVAGFYGGTADALLMRLTELFLALPWLYLLLAVRAFLPLDLAPAAVFALLIGVIGLLGWPRTARLVRGVTLGLRHRPYVAAARGFGAADLYLLRHHLLPLVRPVLLTQLTVLVPRYVVAEVSLSLLGLGVAEPAPSWGGLLAMLRRYEVAHCWWMWLPAAALAAVIWAYHRLADSLERQAAGQSDPQTGQGE